MDFYVFYAVLNNDSAALTAQAQNNTIKIGYAENHKNLINETSTFVVRSIYYF